MSATGWVELPRDSPSVHSYTSTDGRFVAVDYGHRVDVYLLRGWVLLGAVTSLSEATTLTV